MDKTTLVNEDVRMGQDVIAWLAAAGIPVDDAFWAYQAPAEEWWLFLSSAWVDQKGIRDAYLALSNALHKSPIRQQLPLRRISLLSPSDPLAKNARNYLVQDYVSESYRYAGALHVVRSIGRRGRKIYQITFAPYRSSGGSVPAMEVTGDEALSQFLTDQIGIDPSDMRHALKELQLRGSYSFPDVQLHTKDLRTLGLLPKSVRKM
jgi:hypothetical protein